MRLETTTAPGKPQRGSELSAESCRKPWKLLEEGRIHSCPSKERGNHFFHQSRTGFTFVAGAEGKNEEKTRLRVGALGGLERALEPGSAAGARDEQRGVKSFQS